MLVELEQILEAHKGPVVVDAYVLGRMLLSMPNRDIRGRMEMFYKWADGKGYRVTYDPTINTITISKIYSSITVLS